MYVLTEFKRPAHNDHNERELRQRHDGQWFETQRSYVFISLDYTNAYLVLDLGYERAWKWKWVGSSRRRIFFVYFFFYTANHDSEMITLNNDQKKSEMVRDSRRDAS